MPQHVSEWLNAYHDGELRGRKEAIACGAQRDAWNPRQASADQQDRSSQKRPPIDFRQSRSFDHYCLSPEPIVNANVQAQN